MKRTKEKMPKENPGTSLAIKSKALGSELIRFADSQARNATVQQMAGLVNQIRTMRKQADYQLEEVRYAIAWFDAKLTAIADGEFSIIEKFGVETVHYKNPDLNFNTPAESKILRTPMHIELPPLPPDDNIVDVQDAVRRHRDKGGEEI